MLGSGRHCEGAESRRTAPRSECAEYRMDPRSVGVVVNEIHKDSDVAARRRAASTAPSWKVGRLLLVTSDYHFHEGDKIHTTSAFMRFVPELLSLAKTIEVCAPIHTVSAGEQGFGIESEAIRYNPLPPSRTLEQFLRKLPADLLPILRALYEAARRSDLVWINGPHPLLPLAALACRLAGKPYLLWMRGDILETTRSKYAGSRLRNRLALRTAYFLDKLMQAAARNRVVFYTGSGLSRYAVLASYSQPARTSLVSETDVAAGPKGPLHRPVRLLWAGQLRPVKGLKYLLGALRLLLDEGYEVCLTLLGDGEQRDELEEEVKRLELHDHVALAGYVAPGPSLSAYFESADLFVLPSLSEGVPKVLLEAMAHGLPIVATEVGGVPDLIRDGETGVLVPPQAPRQLTDAIARLLEHDDLRRTVSEQAVAFAREHTAAAEVARIGEGLHRAFPNVMVTA